jgi:hypothetical protein
MPGARKDPQVRPEGPGMARDLRGCSVSLLAGASRVLKCVGEPIERVPNIDDQPVELGRALRL